MFIFFEIYFLSQINVKKCFCHVQILEIIIYFYLYKYVMLIEEAFKSIYHFL